MKIRHKQSGVELEGVRDCGPDFVEGASVIQPSSIYSKEHWEAVPEWVEVTRECEVLQGIRLWHGEKAIADLSPGYRLRRVLVSIDGLPTWAFIVERKA